MFQSRFDSSLPAEISTQSILGLPFLDLTKGSEHGGERKEIEMYTFSGYKDMEKELATIARQHTEEVLYLPRKESPGTLWYIHDTNWLTFTAGPFYCGPGRPSKWPSVNCDKVFPANDFTDIGYQDGSLACVARIITAKFIGHGCRVEWLNQWRCFPDNDNYLDLREDNIFFQTREEYAHDTYEEWNLGQMKNKWMRECT